MKKRWIMRLLLALLLLVAAGAGGLWLMRAQLAEKVVRQELAKLNISVPSLQVTGVSRQRITLSDVALGEGGAVRVQQAVIHFPQAWDDLKNGYFRAELEGVQMRALLQDGAVQLGGIERSWGAAEVTPNAKALAIALDAALQVDRTPARTGFVVTKGLITVSQNQKNLLLPLVLDATGELMGTKFSAQGSFADARTIVKGTLRAQYDMQQNIGNITWNTDSIRFDAAGFTFAQLSPLYAEGFETIASTAAVRGTVELAPGKWTVKPTLTIVELPVERLLSAAFGEGAQVKGSVQGSVPIRLTQGGGWRIEKSRLVNIGPMEIRVNPATAGQALSAHPQAELVQQALSNLQVETLTLDVSSTDSKGGVKLDWHFVGRNPELLGGKPVDLTLAVTLNVRDMWRSVQEVKNATREAEKLLRAQER